MAQVLKPLRWHKSTLTVAPKPTPVAQADFSRNLKPAPAAKLFVFSDFLFALAFRKVLFVFHLKSTPRGTKSTIVVACKVRFTWQSKVDFQSRISKSAPRGTKPTSVFKSHFIVRSTRHKVDFGFQVAFQSPLRAAQSRLRFSSHISKSAPRGTKSTSVFKLHSKVRSTGI
jgi:hypothetical protein